MLGFICSYKFSKIFNNERIFLPKFCEKYATTCINSNNNINWKYMETQSPSRANEVSSAVFWRIQIIRFYDSLLSSPRLIIHATGDSFWWNRKGTKKARSNSQPSAVPYHDIFHIKQCLFWFRTRRFTTLSQVTRWSQRKLQVTRWLNRRCLLSRNDFEMSVFRLPHQ